MVVSLIIPTLNGREQIGSLIESLHAQSRKPDEIIVIDSQSQDGTAEYARTFAGVQVISISKSEFDHGGTRDLGVRSSSGEIVLFMTQDALPTDCFFIEKLLEPFADPQVAAVSGRQIAWSDAPAYEREVRAFNYPDKSRTWSKEDVPALGVRAYTISDVAAAYRREAYFAVGGFDHPVMTNEDMLMAQKLLCAGYRLAYSAQASVYHSHQFTWMQQFRRNQSIGQVLERYAHRFACESEMGEGMALVRHVLFELLRKGRFADCVRFCWDCSARLLGNRAGRWKERKNRHAAGGITDKLL